MDIDEEVHFVASGLLNKSTNPHSSCDLWFNRQWFLNYQLCSHNGLVILLLTLVGHVVLAAPSTCHLFLLVLGSKEHVSNIL